MFSKVRSTNKSTWLKLAIDPLGSYCPLQSIFNNFINFCKFLQIIFNCNYFAKFIIDEIIVAARMFSKVRSQSPKHNVSWIYLYPLVNMYIDQGERHRLLRASSFLWLRDLANFPFLWVFLAEMIYLYVIEQCNKYTSMPWTQNLSSWCLGKVVVKYKVKKDLFWYCNLFSKPCFITVILPITPHIGKQIVAVRSCN